MSATSSRHTGFTLVEMVVVLVVLGIVSVFGMQFVVTAISSYNTTVNRSALMNKGRMALERISRQVRFALPNSARVRTIAGLECLEFIPIAGAGSYVGNILDLINPSLSTNIIPTGHYQVYFGQASRLFVAPLSVAEVYGSGVSVSLTSVLTEGASGTSLSVGATPLIRNSVSQRFFLVDEAQAFCYGNNEVRYFDSSADVSAGAGDLLMDNVTATQPFFLSNGTLDLNTLVTLTFTVSQGGESVELQQQGLIHNVP